MTLKVKINFKKIARKKKEGERGRGRETMCYLSQHSHMIEELQLNCPDSRQRRPVKSQFDREEGRQRGERETARGEGE